MKVISAKTVGQLLMDNYQKKVNITKTCIVNDTSFRLMGFTIEKADDAKSSA